MPGQKPMNSSSHMSSMVVNKSTKHVREQTRGGLRVDISKGGWDGVLPLMDIYNAAGLTTCSCT